MTDKKDKVNRTISVDPEKWRKFKETCVRENKDMSEVLSEHIEGYVEEHSEGNPQHKLTDYDDIVIPVLPTVPSRYSINDWARFETKRLGDIKNSYSVSLERINKILDDRKIRSENTQYSEEEAISFLEKCLEVNGDLEIVRRIAYRQSFNKFLVEEWIKNKLEK